MDILKGPAGSIRALRKLRNSGLSDLLATEPDMNVTSCSMDILKGPAGSIRSSRKLRNSGLSHLAATELHMNVTSCCVDILQRPAGFTRALRKLRNSGLSQAAATELHMNVTSCCVDILKSPAGFTRASRNWVNLGLSQAAATEPDMNLAMRSGRFSILSCLKNSMETVFLHAGFSTQTHIPFVITERRRSGSLVPRIPSAQSIRVATYPGVVRRVRNPGILIREFNSTPG